MNRLVLIGNGFDLAHGLKTGYKDFLSHYLRNALDTFYTSNFYSDPLLEIAFKDRSSNIINKGNSKEYDDIISEISALNYNTPFYGCYVKYKSAFLAQVIKSCTQFRWVDIENQYFRSLKNCSLNRDKISNLNIEFDFLKIELEKYLSIIDKINTSKSNHKISQLVCEGIKFDEIVLPIRTTWVNPKNIYILNFNYTSTFNKYFAACNLRNNLSINFIHGELNQASNPIIFGFGDEFDKDYIEFENHTNNELFKHIKSFEYFKTSNYHQLIRFLDSDEYQVQILGHSCGLSDRTMLKQIFEHSNCKSIKIFHHLRPDGTNDYTEKTYDIARHFSDKGMMRKKIVPFDKTHCMPQN